MTPATLVTLVASLLAPPAPGGEDLAALPAAVEWLEVRADLIGEQDAHWLRQCFRGRLLYTLRSATEGGGFAGGAAERQRRLLAARRDYDLIDLEGERDLTPELLEAIPPQQRLISWHGRAADAAELSARVERFSRVAARLYKLVQRTARSGEEIELLTMLKRMGRVDVVAFAAGQQGFWSRLAALPLGAPWLFGAARRGCESCGEVAITQLMEDYGLPKLAGWDEVYGIVGSPVAHSLSPRLHNAAYRALGRRALFVPFHADSFSDFWQRLVLHPALTDLGLPVNGCTVASPHKEAALAQADASSALVKRSGATNIFIRKEGAWEANTTDPEGALVALRRRGIAVAGKKAAVIGCGGAGRAVAAALDEAGADVTLVNRGRARGEQAVALLDLPFVPLSEFSVAGFSLLVNATPVGRNDNQLPCDVDGLSAATVVIDLPYGASPTPLVQAAEAAHCTVIDGREVLLIQVLHQFRLMTGEEMPVGLARRALGLDSLLVEAATA